ncbi:aminopeptidase, partial [Streptococcus pneumoniae]|nr:aminopeptidase [Streptococcus pneumoniae]
FLDLSRETKTFSGKVTITGQAQSDRISLHQKDLEITSVEVAGQARPFTVDHDNEALHIELAEAGQVELVLAFSGKITDNMTGRYRACYT